MVLASSADTPFGLIIIGIIIIFGSYVFTSGSRKANAGCVGFIIGLALIIVGIALSVAMAPPS